MKVGSIGYCTDQGLGILLKSFYDHGVVTDVMIAKHSRSEHYEWFPNARRMLGKTEAERFCLSVDVMLFFETPFYWELLPYCREHGIKTILMPMYECEPRVLPTTPDLLLCPSLLDLQYYEGQYANPTGGAGALPAIFLPIPVEVPWRQRTKAEVFVHNAGHGGLKGRNGTRELLQAIRLVKSPAKFLIRCQKDQDWPPYSELLGRAELTTGTLPYGLLYDYGDVFIFPEKFNGLSLPLQEARAAGMLVMGSDRFPMNTWLPREPLIPVQGYQKSCVSPRCLEFDEAIISPKDIAAKIDDFYGTDISTYSLQGKEWAEANSWAVLGPKYRKVLEDLVGGKK